MKKVNHYLGVAALMLITLCATAVLGACSKDDDNGGKTANRLTVDGKNVPLTGILATEFNNHYGLNLYSLSGNFILFSAPIAKDNQTIDLSQKGDWLVRTNNIAGSNEEIEGDGDSKLLEKGSTLLIHKTGQATYKVVFHLIQTVNGKRKVVQGSFEGKSITGVGAWRILP